MNNKTTLNMYTHVHKWVPEINKTMFTPHPCSIPVRSAESSLRDCVLVEMQTVADMSTAVEQVVACALVTQRARIRSPVGTSFLGEVFLGVFPHLWDKCQDALGPEICRSTTEYLQQWTNSASTATPPCSLGVGEFLFVYSGKPFMHLRVHMDQLPAPFNATTYSKTKFRIPTA